MSLLDPAPMQTPAPAPELSSTTITSAQLPKIDDLKVEDWGSFELTVYPGEDVVAKVFKVWEASNCIISATGHISKAEFGRPSSDIFHRYDGHFEILSMSGKCMDQGDGSAAWSLSITLAGSDGVAFGGTFINKLIASDTVTLLMMNFVKEKEKSTEKNCDEAGTSTAADDETTAKASSYSAEKKKKNKKKGAVPAPLPLAQKILPILNPLILFGSREFPVLFQLTVYPGEDVVAKVFKVWEASNCIISATGRISKAEFGRPSSNIFHRYNGHFEILSMSGNCVDEGNGSAAWSLSITLAGSDGVAFGGTFINKLIASDTVTLLMMNFVKEKEKSTEKNCNEAGTSAAADDDETTAKASSDSVEKKKKKKKKNKKKGAVPAPLPLAQKTLRIVSSLILFGSREFPVLFELTVYPGEDVAAKLLTFWQVSYHSSCIISAAGHISKAEFGRPSSDIFHRYDGHFEILSLSGNCVVEGHGSVAWSRSITLAGSDGVAFGGSFINKLIASDTVTLLMMNFVKVKEKSTEKNCDEAGTSAAGFFDCFRIWGSLVNESDKEKRD